MICSLCPKGCNAKRDENENLTGFCKMPLQPRVARAALHFWEEPCISGKNGSGTVFFSGCNLNCVFCQNYGVSHGGYGKAVTYKRLADIFKELEADLGIAPPSHGCLTDWAAQGVLLLNTVLTVRRGQANSHKGKGWEIFTDRVIELLNEREKPIVFILWGANAKSKREIITNPNHIIITGAHPSPLSAHNGFFGGRYFSRTNAYLTEKGEMPIDWMISE